MENQNNNKRQIEQVSTNGVAQLIKDNKRQKVVTKNKKVRVLAAKDKSIQTTNDQVKEALELKGYCVVPSQFVNKAVRDGCKELIDKDVMGFREFKDGDGVDRSPLGGFGVYNNPSSFHCPTVRDLREVIYAEFVPYIDTLLEGSPNTKKEFIIDRLMVRPAGSSPSPEMWHRDESPGAVAGDVVLGGWLNLDNGCQVFSCVPGTHRAVETDGGGSGFNLIRRKELIAEYNSKRTKVSVPPGHVLIFNENIIHEVVSSTKKEKSYRLFIGWRLTNSSTPIVDGLDDMLDTQSAVTIKSGQTPPMWAKLHWTNWIEKLERYSANFRDECLEEAEVKSGRLAGKVVTRVHRHMKSLVDYGFPLYNPYTKEERSMHFPH